MRALREAHNFSNGVHTLRQDEALHGFVTLSSRLAISSTVDKLQRLAYDALEAESEIFDIRETMHVNSSLLHILSVLSPSRAGGGCWEFCALMADAVFPVVLAMSRVGNRLPYLKSYMYIENSIKA